MNKSCLTLAILISLVACGGGNSSTVQNPTTSGKPLVDYRPNFFSIAAGSYSTLCDPDGSPRTFNFSPDGLFSPGISGVVDLKLPRYLLSFSRGKSGETEAVDALEVGFGVLGSSTSNNPTGLEINSRSGGLVVDTEFLAGGINTLRCQPTPAAVSIRSKTAYAAFSEFIEAKKTAVLCWDVFAPIPRATINSFYEVVAGELTVQDEVIPLLSGITHESIGDSARLIRNGSDVQNITYLIERADGRTVAMVFNEYGDMASLMYKSSSGQTFQCFLSSPS
jgi:hypothetical protein